MMHSSQESADNDIAIIVGILKSRKLVILSFFVAAIALAFIYVSKATPQYVATSEILISSSQNVNASNILQAIGASSALDITDLRSRVEILQSPDMVRFLIDEANLYNVSEIGGNADFSSLADASVRRREIMVAQVKRRLAVKPVLGTSLVNVSYRSDNPILAADVANGLIDLYIEKESKGKREQAQQASDWLGDRLDSLREEVRAAEIALDQEKQDNILSATGAKDSRLQQIDLLGRKMATIESEYTAKKVLLAKLEHFEDEDQVVAMTAANHVSQNRTILAHKSEMISLKQHRAQLAQKYGPNHPSMQAINKQISVLRASIDLEIKELIGTIANEVEITKITLDGLKEKIGQYRESYQSDSSVRVAIRDLESEARTARDLLNSFMSSYRQSLQSIDFQKSNVKIISKATPPTSASYPKKHLVVALCGITGLFIGIFITLVLEKLQNVFQSVAQIEKITRIPVYGVLAKAKKLKSKNPADFILDHISSGMAELVRSLYMALELRDPKKTSGGRVVTVTSTLPNEGKTTTSIWLGTVAAKNGDKVLVIDADMRRPSLHKKYEIGNAKGLADYLSDRLPLEDVIYDKHPSGVHIMTSKAIPTHALTLLTSDRMEAMVRRTRDMYDLVIIDVPTALVFSDARVMAKLSDKTFYVVEWKKTRRDILMSSVKQFTDMGYKDLAIVLNKAEVSHHIENKKGDMAYLYQMNDLK